MLNNLSENLNRLMSKARINSDELARKIGIPATTIKRIRNNEQANPTISTLIPIATFFAVSIDQLIGVNSSIGSENVTSTALKVSKIPIFSWQEFIHCAPLKPNTESKFILTERLVNEKAFALIIEENDLDFFPRNSILIVNPKEIPQHGDYVIIINKDHTIASIRKYIIEIDQIYLKPLMPGMSISTLTSDFQVLGVIIQYKMELKLNPA